MLDSGVSSSQTKSNKLLFKITVSSFKQSSNLQLLTPSFHLPQNTQTITAIIIQPLLTPLALLRPCAKPLT